MPDETTAIRLTRDDPDREVWGRHLGKVGEVVDVPAELAARLLELGYAEAVKPSKAKGKK